jgi:hypothetical protein
MSLPRILDSCLSVCDSKEVPSNRMSPARRAVWGSRPITAMDETDLPEPDSPTIPSVSPGATV